MAGDPLILHEDPVSGNCYKIRLTAAHAGTALERRGYDIRAGETRTPRFLAEINPNGRIPVLQIGTRFLPESNAACWYLAEQAPEAGLIPTDGFARADALRWMFFEQYQHEPNIATLRFWRLGPGGEAGLDAARRAQLPAKRSGGAAALALMEAQLARQAFLLPQGFSLADIVLYAYTHVAEEAGFALADYPAVRAWLARVAARPGHVPMA
ncbi:glutathione S-transferase family protein [Sphingomonas morindae]|uniref:Glutathione S-transferase family protein n=1 Tax=Sphingomonas morindae TaxID=1541170 RepID=A0ABY4X7J5_9SPHN|nr:glutathione S-transferase family protein [Sphingomonas morindae]USI72927.1 glutathione S-transferase family protein [Sphingomonas morindae]